MFHSSPVLSAEVSSSRDSDLGRVGTNSTCPRFSPLRHANTAPPTPSFFIRRSALSTKWVRLSGSEAATGATGSDSRQEPSGKVAYCDTMCRSLCRWLPVLFVATLIGWCYWVYMTDIVLPMVRLSPGESSVTGSHQMGVSYLIAFNCLFGLGMISFVCAIFTDPGQIPEAWAVGAEDSEAAQFFPQLQTLETKHDGSRRVCRKSKPNMYKPDRAHFCKMLSHCVLKMDHFCPWLNNCIGFYNHKFFYLFILYMASLTVFMLTTMAPTFVHDVTSMEEVMIDFTVSASLPSRPPPVHRTRPNAPACHPPPPSAASPLRALALALAVSAPHAARPRLTTLVFSARPSSDGVPRDAHLPRALLAMRRPRVLLQLPHVPAHRQLHHHRVPREAWLQPAGGPQKPLRHRLVGQHHLGARRQPARVAPPRPVVVRRRWPLLQAQPRLVPLRQGPIDRMSGWVPRPL